MTIFATILRIRFDCQFPTYILIMIPRSIGPDVFTFYGVLITNSGKNS